MISKQPYGSLYERSDSLRQSLSHISTKALEITLDYAVEATPELVSTKLQFDDAGKVLDNEFNRNILIGIEIALQTSDFDRAAIRGLFENATDYFLNAEPQINLIMEKIRSDGKKIILDGVDLSNLSLQCLHFEGASARAAIFIGSAVKFLTGADLTDANFTNAYMSCGQFAGTIRVGLIIEGAKVDNVTWNDLEHDKAATTQSSASSTDQSVSSITLEAPPRSRATFLRSRF
ncbi:uncharacterized protein YjbI with pentapeptide repeats [Oxalobacteraceae bacterium GrIS 2.11]